MRSESVITMQVLDLECVDGRLKGKLTEIAPAAGKSLTVAINSKPRLSGFRPLSNGVAYVRDAAVTSPASKEVQLEFLGKSDGQMLYRWAETAHSGVGLAVVILPRGNALDRPGPKPIGAKLHDGRLAVFWMPQGEALSWFMQKTDTEPYAAAEQINKTAGEPPSQPGIAVLASVRGAGTEWRWSLPGLALAGAAGVVAIAILVVASGLIDGNHDDNRGVIVVPEVSLDQPYTKSYALVVGIDK